MIVGRPPLRYPSARHPPARYPVGPEVVAPVFAALVPNTDGTIALQAKGVGTPTFARASTALVEAWNGTYVECATNEARFAGARRISQGVWSWKDASNNPIHPTRFLAGQRLFAFYAERSNTNNTNSIEFELGDRIWATATDGLRYYYECTTAGTSAATPPVFPTSGTVADGSVVWTFGGLYRFRGLLLEPAATNLFLNSDSPATQTISITETGNYTVSVIGSGSATSSDNTATSTGHGAASAGTPVTFNVSSTGTVDITISGSPTYVQVEAGTVPTSPIVTAGSAVTRATEVNAAQWQRDANFVQAAGMAIVHMDASYPNALIAVGILGVRTDSRSSLIYSNAGTDNWLSFDGTNLALVNYSDVGARLGFGVRWSGTGYSLTGKPDGGGATSNSAPYDGAWITSGAGIRVGHNSLTAGSMHLSNLLIFDKDLGQTWIEANV